LRYGVGMRPNRRSDGNRVAWIDSVVLRRMENQDFAVCIRNTDFKASLEVRNLYRVIDESGKDYLYPAELFEKVTLPLEVQRALRLTVRSSLHHSRTSEQAQ
jgi:hypothetical protein